MASITAIWGVDYSVTPITNSVGVVTNSASGVIQLGKRRIVMIWGSSQVAPPSANKTILRYTLGLSTGVVAPAPSATSPFVFGDLGFPIDLGDYYDQIQIASLTADNGAGAVAYCVTPVSKF